MRIRLFIRAFTLTLGLGLGAACSDLSGPKLSDDPNSPTEASNPSLFVAAQVNMFLLQESHLARTICMWMQQCAGVAQQYLANAVYQATEDEYYTQWSQIYSGGGLVDLRIIERQALDQGDSAFAGVALVYEAWFITTAADIWGDVPYSEAANPSNATPQLDPQAQVYTSALARLDTAITYLSSASPASVGPGASDLVYGGDLGRWIALAHTLKARIHLHTAETNAGAYALALAEAQQGIADPAGDYNAYHDVGANSANIWSQFAGAWQGYIAPGNFILDSLMEPRADPRLFAYFNLAGPGPNQGTFIGAINGVDFDNSGVISPFSSTRLADAFPQPLVTWAENQLIVAEASYQTGAPGAALIALEAERAAAGYATPLAPPPAGAALLAAIMTEKYVVTFQNIETWNDFKRTCIPGLTPAGGALVIPGRLVYPLSERNANSSIPDAGPFRNPNDPSPCP